MVWSYERELCMSYERGPAECPVCGEERETVYFLIDGLLVCRDHDGHPLR